MRRVQILVYDGVQSLDVTGPLEVFWIASQLEGGEAYAVEVLGPTADPVRTGSGLTIVPDRAARSSRGRVDTLVVAGGVGSRAAARDEALVAWLRAAAGRSRRVASVCTGAFLLARAGLLDGRRATTHWASCDELARRHPEIEVDPDPIFVADGVYTSAGVTAGMDLALALVEEDLGQAAALEVARWLVLYVRRPGGQAQFSAHLSAQLADRQPLRELQGWIAGNLDADLSVPALAARAYMSERNFARAFRRETGMTPAAYVEAVRVEQARLRLETTGAKLETVARDSGFGTVETMRRAFHRRLHVAPADYRERFRAETAPRGQGPATTRGGHDGDRNTAVRQVHGARRRRPV